MPRKMFLFMLLSAISLTTYAGQWSKQFTQDYPMGDGDSRSNARQMALEQLKVKASAEAGTYVQSMTQLQGDDLRETVQMLSASMVKVSNMREDVSVNSAGQTVFHLSATATIDEGELARRVSALQQDQQKASQIQKLQRDNQKLQEQLQIISKEMANHQVLPERAALLLTQQNETLRKMQSNQQSAQQVFQKGTLLQLARKNESSMESVKLELERSLLGPILQTPIRAEVENVIENGDRVTVLVRVGWNISSSQVEKSAGKYLSAYNFNLNPVLEFSSYNNTKGEGPNIATEQVFNFLISQRINARIRVGRHVIELPVLYSGSGFMDTCHQVDSQGTIGKSLCITNLAYSDANIVTDYQKQNPLKFIMSAQEAASISQVDAVMVRK